MSRYEIHFMVEKEVPFVHGTNMYYRPACNTTSFYNAVYVDEIEKVTCENCMRTKVYRHHWIMKSGEEWEKEISELKEKFRYTE